jgi:hypothetical protein
VRYWRPAVAVGLFAAGSWVLLARDGWTCPASRHLPAGAERVVCEGAASFQDSRNGFVARGSLSEFESFVVSIAASASTSGWRDCGKLEEMQRGSDAHWCRYSERYQIKEEAAWSAGKIRFAYSEW